MLLQGTDAAYIFLRGTLERREHLGRWQKWKERGDSVSTLSDTTAGKGEKRQRGAIRDELFMTSLLSGASNTDLEFSICLPFFTLAGQVSLRVCKRSPLSFHFCRRPRCSLLSSW